jgi:ferric iron reductase protein FhuF
VNTAAVVAGNPMLSIGVGPPDSATAAVNLRAAELVDAVGAWLGTPERRVAASMVVLGYAARLVGPTVAVMLRDGVLLDARPARVSYAYAPERGFRLWLDEATGWRGPAPELRTRWCRDVVDDHLGALVVAVRAVVPVAAGLLWGNVASGLAGALQALVRDGAVPAGQCYAAGVELLEHGPLRGSGHLSGELTFLRRSCCLYYRLDGGGYCGDCPLPTPEKGNRA